jgi:hypothetical protein
MDEATKAAQLLPVDRLVEFLPAVYLCHEEGRRIVNGLAVSGLETAAGLVRLYDSMTGFMGLGNNGADGKLTAKRLISQLPAAENSYLRLD